MKFYFVGFFVKIKVSHLQDSSTAAVVPTLVLFKVKVCCQFAVFMKNIICKVQVKFLASDVVSFNLPTV